MSDIPNKLRFCCLPVLPTIFSDELSYLDVLSKMRDYINQMIDAIKQQDEDIAKIQEQVDKVDPSKYIQTSGGTLTGPLFFIDQDSVVKNADGTFTVQSNNPLVIKTGQTAAVNATGGVEIRSGGTVLVTGNDGVSILDKSSAGVAVFEGNTAIAGNIEINGPTTFGDVVVDMHNARTKVMNLHGDGNVTIDTPESIAIEADKHVDITAGNGTVGIEGPIVDIHAAKHVNIDTGNGGSVVIGGAKSAVDMGNAVSVMVPTPLKGIEAANKNYVDNLIGPRMKMLKRITAQAPYLGIPGDDFANYVEANIFIQASTNSTPNEVWIGTILLQGGSVSDCHVVSIDAITGAQQLIDPARFAVTSSGIIIQGLSLSASRGCYFVIPS